MSLITDGVTWVWPGAVTTSGFTVTAKVRTGATVRLAVDTDPAFWTPTYFTPSSTSADVAKINATGLAANTLYHAAVEVDGVINRGERCQVTTFPSGAATFTFAAASCSGGSGALVYGNHMVWDSVRQAAPLFFLHTGDLHYEDSQAVDYATWRGFYDNVMSNTRVHQFFRNVPTVYMPDNHDWLLRHPLGVAAGTDRIYPRTAFQERVPHYPLAEGLGNTALYHSFVCGRVRFIVTDTVSERSDWTDTDNASKSMLGTAQKAWFKAQLLAATEPVICWVMTSQPWIGTDTAALGNDRWPRYSTERTELVNFITANGLASKMFMITGDAHSFAYDDGTNTPGGFKLFQAAPLDRPGNTMGGPFSSGTPMQATQQFGVFTITDTGGATINVAFSGRRPRASDSRSVSEVISYNFNIAA